MGAIAHLETKSLPVTPGGEAVAEIRVRNSGTVVDQFTIWVLGDAEPWASAEPATLSLLPGGEEKARIVFRPPRSAEVPAGTMPFGVHVQSKEDPAGSVVEEGVLEIGPFSDTFAELVPRTSRGSRGAAHDLAIDNRGNARLNATITAADPDRLLEFDMQPPAVVADPGTAAFSKINVKPRKRFWRGAPQTRPFRVQVETAEGPPFGVEGTLLQESILPPWFLKALLAIIGAIILALLFWIFFLQPTIESSARERAEERAEEILAQHGLTPIPGTPGGPDDPNGPTPAGPNGPSPGTSPGNGDGSPPPDGSPTPALPTLPGGMQPRDGRIAAGGAGPAITEGRSLFITDLVFSNRNTDAAGDITLRRGQEPLIVLRAENFRDLDFHFVTPMAIAFGQEFRLDCNLTVGSCDTIAVYFSGFER